MDKKDIINRLSEIQQYGAQVWQRDGDVSKPDLDKILCDIELLLDHLQNKEIVNE